MFEIQNQQKSNKTIHIPNELIDRLQTITDQNNISFNQFVVQFCEYALNDMLKSDE